MDIVINWLPGLFPILCLLRIAGAEEGIFYIQSGIQRI